MFEQAGTYLCVCAIQQQGAIECKLRTLFEFQFAQGYLLNLSKIASLFAADDVILSKVILTLFFIIISAERLLLSKLNIFFPLHTFYKHVLLFLKKRNVSGNLKCYMRHNFLMNSVKLDLFLLMFRYALYVQYLLTLFLPGYFRMYTYETRKSTLYIV